MPIINSCRLKKRHRRKNRNETGFFQEKHYIEIMENKHVHERTNNLKEGVVFCSECGAQLDDFWMTPESKDPALAKARSEWCKKQGRFNGKYVRSFSSQQQTRACLLSKKTTKTKRPPLPRFLGSDLLPCNKIQHSNEQRPEKKGAEKPKKLTRHR